MKNMYSSLAVAINELRKEGYTEDLNLCGVGIENKKLKRMHAAKDFNVVQYFRFEGMTNPGDNTVLYAIETTNGDKGLLVDGYGMYSGNISKELIEKLKISE
ncbi:hypothetical protein SAMN04487911_102199 [Arenibacter nanhaiticus]|uniref:Phosphoribosylpyrophosphate synthetase n=1 Tax=Arenibacter nanhaiticus TaxID=558155 RepID=A0A1M6BHK2_9FLAO|nr:phosphoribosylpyrophosphate synthetase [Arenibacter nanhaiticus]SHI48068.1 hypothetical protein SAMN04487911_102199 [Arenibacter nanhaiticus]